MSHRWSSGAIYCREHLTFLLSDLAGPGESRAPRVLFLTSLAIGLPKGLMVEMCKPFQSDAPRGLLLAGKWVGDGAWIAPGAALKLLSHFARTAALWQLVLVKDR